MSTKIITFCFFIFRMVFSKWSDTCLDYNLDDNLIDLRKLLTRSKMQNQSTRVPVRRRLCSILTLFCETTGLSNPFDKTFPSSLTCTSNSDWRFMSGKQKLSEVLRPLDFKHVKTSPYNELQSIVFFGTWALDFWTNADWTQKWRTGPF